MIFDRVSLWKKHNFFLLFRYPFFPYGGTIFMEKKNGCTVFCTAILTNPKSILLFQQQKLFLQQHFNSWSFFWERVSELQRWSDEEGRIDEMKRSCGLQQIIWRGVVVGCDDVELSLWYWSFDLICGDLSWDWGRVIIIISLPLGKQTGAMERSIDN